MSNEHNAGKFDALERVPDFEARAAGLSLRGYEWEFALALDGKAAAVTIGKRLGIDAEVVKAAVNTLVSKGLAKPKTVSLEDFKREYAPVEQPKPAAPAAASVAVPDRASTPAPVMPPISVKPAGPPPKLAFSLKPSSPSAIPSLPLTRPPAWSAGSAPVQPPSTSDSAAAAAPPPVDGEAKRYKIKPLVDFIIQQAGGSSLPKLATQLAVYRVFRRVPRELILANNIRTLNITDESFEVQSRELYDAIVDAIESTFSVKYARN